MDVGKVFCTIHGNIEYERINSSVEVMECMYTFTLSNITSEIIILLLKL